MAVATTSHLRENPFELAREQLRRVGTTFEIDPNLIAVLGECKKAIEVSIPVSMDDGSTSGLQGLPRHAQHRARAVEGRYPLPPRRHGRRGQGARDVDDVEVRADGDPVRRRQGRRGLRPEEDVAPRARGDDPPFHERDHQRDRAGEGHPGARRRHRRLDDGLDLRHVLDEQGPLGARRRDRQAAHDRRLAGPGRGDLARRALLHPRRRREARQAPRRDEGRRAGLRQRRQLPRAVPAPGGRDRRRDLRLDNRALQPEGHRRPGRFRVQGREPHARRAQGCRDDHERGARAARVRHPRAVRARAGDHRARTPTRSRRR